VVGQFYDLGVPEKHKSRSHGDFRPVEYFTSGCTQACARLQSGDLPRMMKCSGRTGHHSPEILICVPSAVSRHSSSLSTPQSILLQQFPVFWLAHAA
jgi:hypothetical protein